MVMLEPMEMVIPGEELTELDKMQKEEVEEVQMDLGQMALERVNHQPEETVVMESIFL